MTFFQDSQKHLRCRSIVTSIVHHLLTYNDKIYVSKIYPSQLIFEGGANTGGLYSVCFWVYIYCGGGGDWGIQIRFYSISGTYAVFQ